MNFEQYINSIKFEQPVWFIVFVFICLAIIFLKNILASSFLSQLKFNYIYKHTYYNYLINIKTKSPERHSNLLRAFNYLLMFIITGLLFTSLAGPYRQGQKLPNPPENRNVLFLVDNEVSMVLKDYFIDGERVTRLTMVKSVLLNFVNKLSGNRLGIVAFSENAYTLLPFTTDSHLIRDMIPRIKSTLTGRTSNPQKALLYALNYLRNIKNINTAVKPSIVLITDVLRPPREIDPNSVAKYIKKQGYKLYVIAIGASGYKKEDVESSSLVYHPASFERLKQVADSANGDFYWAKNTDSLTNVIDDILKSGTSKTVVRPEYVKLVLFQWPLGLALVLILFHFLFDTLRPAKSA